MTAAGPDSIFSKNSTLRLGTPDRNQWTAEPS